MKAKQKSFKDNPVGKWFRILILFACMALNLFVVGVGAYFFYDLEIAPRFNLHSPEEKLERLSAKIRSAVREPVEQVEAITELENLEPQIDAEAFLLEVETISKVLAQRELPQIVWKRWNQFLKRNQAARKRSDVRTLLHHADLNDPGATVDRQYWFANPPKPCDPELASLAQQSSTMPTISEIEKSLALSYLHDFSQECAASSRK